MRNFPAVFILLAALVLSSTAKATVTIDSVTTTVSTCANNGSIVIYAQTTSGTLLYAIAGGPSTYPVQTSNNFSSLAPGVYTVEVSNTSNEVQTTTVVISGNYQLPDFSPSVIDPHCPDSSSGSVIGNITFATGLSPYTWELISPSPVTRPPQFNDTFDDLSAGNYSIRLTDGCNNVQTKTVILSAGAVPMTYLSGFAKMSGCDTIEMAMQVLTPAFRPPYKVSYTIAGVPYSIDTASVDDESIFNGYPNVYFTIPNLSYGGIIDNIVITNGCGVAAYAPQQRLCPFQLRAHSFIPIATSDCQNGLLTSFVIGNLSCTMTLTPKFPLTVTIRDIPGNNIVEVKTYHVYDNTFASTAMAPNTSYNVSMVDSCGNSNSIVVTTPASTRYVSLGSNVQQAMLDSTMNASLAAVGFPTIGTTLTITGGPVSAHSTKPGYAYNENYVYPKTFTGQLSSDSSTFFSLANTAPGIYIYVITDSCGNQFPGSFEITTNDVASFYYSYQYQKGCVGSSGLQYEVRNSQCQVNLTDIASGAVIHTLYPWQMNPNPFTNVVNNITASDYEFSLYYFGRGRDFSMNNILVDTFIVRDTIHVSPYQNPALKTTAVTSCNGQLFLALIADSTKGIAPYQYEIISGPQTFPQQSGNIFNLLIAGNYTIRLIDSCGNSVSTNVTVSPLVFPPITSLGNPCSNDTALLTYGASSYFSYTWTRPDGSTYSGDSLLIHPVTAADTGTYIIQRITTINGCSNTETTTYHLTFGKQDSSMVSICSGQTYLFGNSVLSTAGIYRDTISTAGCDSISILNLVINNFKKDSSAVSICDGQTYLFGTTTLSQTGIYRDTLTTATCDSISIINLTVNPLRIDSSTVTICRGQTYVFGSSMLSTAGIYRDTFHTAPCDSMSILNLVVNELKRDSNTVSICRGQTYSFGSRILSTAGIYRDTIAATPCDSISVLNLVVNELKRDSNIVSICRGQTYAFGSRVLSTAGIYRDTIAATPCDSISILNLVVNELKRDSNSVSICRGQTYSFGGRILSTAGIYRDTIAATPCDSISILNLVVNELKRDSNSVSICRGQTYIFGGRVLSIAGIYRDTIAATPCDSISILNLVVNELKRDSNTVSICRGQTYIFGGRVLSIAGIYRDTIAATPCDSISILNLVVNELKRDSNSVSVCRGQTYIFGGRVLSIAGIYRDTIAATPCDSISILNLVVNERKTDSIAVSICKGRTYTFGNRTLSNAGIYKDTFPTVSCDSIAVLNLSVYEIPALQIQSDQYVVTSSETIHLTATPSNLAGYLWTSLNAITPNNIYNPSSIVTKPSWYKVTVTDANNCRRSDSIFISLKPDSILTCDNIHIIFIPTAFSPNYDTWNDEFKILGLNNISYRSYHLVIYNRWGELIFESKTATRGWDGTYKNQPAEVGNYVYLFQFICADGKVLNRKGNILLLR